MAPRPVLEPAALYCIWFSRGLGDGTFHWAIGASADTAHVVKMHATNLQGGWVYEKKTENIVESQTACVAVKIGQLSSDWTDVVDRVSNILEQIPMAIPSVDQSIERVFTCRVWLKEAVRVLAANGFIYCADVAALEREVKAYGQAQDEKTISGHPLVVHKSTVASG
ncbi:hypothetical protein C8Q78DRAFT_990949 [Trametes maxima]|nr:hypothetical protein C8Q78DRAFT_990949 [Trametes maxima]